MNPDTWAAIPATINQGRRVDNFAGTTIESWSSPGQSYSAVSTVSPWTKDTRKVYQELYRQEQWENSTAPQELSEDLYPKVEALFKAAEEEDFEDGMESEFSKELISLVKRYGDVAMEAIAHLIVYEKVNAEVTSEALRWLGRMDHPVSYLYRRWLLERSLRCSSPMTRDGAALGLASLDDSHAVIYLKQAIQREWCNDLRKDMEQVLAQLESID